MSSELHKRIEVRAYQLWEAAGRPDSGAEQYWLAAEAELEGEAHSGGGIPVTDEQEAPEPSEPDEPPKRARSAKKK
ncbi:MAG: DUF2934 domain-containing protein [Alphaproteobacteria bacterium]|nr:DUF2934 domain-containing protein [Alphaproteobacteria bacterium]